jgi:predicted transcriptional regulator
LAVFRKSFVTLHHRFCSVDAVRKLIDDYVSECEPRLREQLAFVSDTQKELLYAISEEGHPVKSITAATFIKKHKLKSPSAVQAAARKLLEYDLLTRNEDFYSIADPLLAIWLRSKRF